MDFYEKIISDAVKRKPNYLFDEGDIVRVKKFKYDDGQTPKYWEGAKAKVVHRKSTVMYGENWYTLRHENGSFDDFKEGELDLRYQKKFEW